MDIADQAQASIFLDQLRIEHKDLSASILRLERSRGSRRNTELEKQIRKLGNDRSSVERMIERLRIATVI